MDSCNPRRLADSGTLRPRTGLGRDGACDTTFSIVMLLSTLVTPLMSLASLVTKVFWAAFLATPPTVTTPPAVVISALSALVE